VGVTRFGFGDDAFESKDAEMSPASGKIGVGNLGYAVKGHRFHYTNASPDQFVTTKELHSNDEIVTGKLQEGYS